MSSNATAKTELLLPAIHRALGGPLQTTLLQAAEVPLFDAERAEEHFIYRLLADGAPTAWLRWLFYALGADAYWRDDWDETRMRLVLARLFELYRSRGTVEGLRLHLGLLADATVVRVAQPPSALYLVPSLTQAERLALEARHPEVRLRPFSESGVRQTAFVGDVLSPPFPTATDAADRLGERASLYDPLTGIETSATRSTVEGAGLIVRVGLRGRAAGIMCGGWLTGATVDHRAASRLYTYALQAGTDDPLLRRASIGAQPGLIPFRVWWTPHHESGAGAGAFLSNRYPDVYPDRGGASLPTIPVRRNAGQRIWKSVRLFNPTRVDLSVRRASVYLGGARIGRVAPHVLETAIQTAGRRPRGVIWPGCTHPTTAFLAASDAPARIARLRWAGNLARRAGCRVSVAIHTKRPLVVGSGVRCGEATTNIPQEVI